MDHIYILALSSRPDRREIISLELLQHNLLQNTTFIRAHTPNSPEVIRLSGGLNLDWVRSHGSPLRCELACLATHMEAMKQIIIKNQPGFIFEDDAILHKEFVSRWKIIKEQITNHELIYIACSGATPEDPSVTKLIKREGIVWGAVGYWITPARALKMVNIYSQPMSRYELRTSECMSLLGENYQVLPLLAIEEPKGVSSLRPNQYSALLLNYFSSWGLENYGGEYRNNPIDKLPFTLLMKKLFENISEEEQIEIKEALRFYLAQPQFYKLQSQYIAQ